MKTAMQNAREERERQTMENIWGMYLYVAHIA
jgi:hypothetical protein